MGKAKKGWLEFGVSYLIWAGIFIAHEGAQAQVKHAPDLPGQTLSLAGIQWNLAEVGGHRVPRDSQQPFFVLKSLDRFQDGSSGQMEDALDGCGNHLTGTYSARGDRSHIDISTSTAMACVIRADTPPPLDLGFLRGESRFHV
jgi:hypothetical protein